MATILIVDDQRTNRAYLTAILETSGHRLLEAADGAEALRILRDDLPDLVISDILMPTIDGYELLRRLRSDPAIRQTPVIFYTAHYHEKESMALAKVSGAAGVLTKGCEPEVLLSAVQAALSRPVPLPEESLAETFDREHLRLVTDKLSQKADELRTTNERLTALINLGLEFGSECDPGQAIESFCKAAREIIGAKYAVAGILTPAAADAGRELLYFLSSGEDSEIAAQLGAPDLRRGPVSTVLTQSRAVRLHNPSGNPIAVDFPSSYPPFHSWLGVPIISGRRVLGWLGLLDKVGADVFSIEDERLAGTLAAQVGRIYENGSLYADMRRHAAELELEVAERKRAEASLTESEERFRQLAENIREVFWLSDPVNETILYVSPAYETVWGQTRRALYASPRSWLEAIHAEDRDRIREAFLTKQAAGKYNEVYRIVRPDGSVRWIHDRGFPVRNHAGQVYRVAGVAEDITERKLLEDQFRQAQKMEAVGRLAGGVAHDFNNLLTLINGYGELVLSKLPTTDPNRASIREMVAAGERAAGLTRQLLTFSRKAIIEPKILDLKAVVIDVDNMLRRILGEDVQLTVVSDPGLGAVKADAGQIEQVLLNLAVNARDAMPCGGRLTIEVRNVELEETYVREHPDAGPGRHVLLAVSDTGCGMDQATMARIFEPFFSTKGDKGTGLGLATVHGIVKQSGGHVAAYSELGQGTVFKVYLPRVEQEAPRDKTRLEPAAIPRGGETILLVEDEDGVRALIRHILKNLGYTIVEAREGTEAVQTAGQGRQPIDLLITDVVMPRMGGREVAERLKMLHPGVKVLYLSGYTDDAVVRHGILYDHVSFLQKPFTAAALARKVRETLDS